jgi:hypothetical protein
MAHQIKLATCCYCGRRTALKNTARGGHELACGACGAPLHNFKAMPMATPKPVKTEPGQGVQGKKVRPVKKRKSIWQKAIEEAWDVVEDIFD